MRRFMVCLTYSVAIGAFAYLSKAFVSADPLWLHDIWAWTAFDRFWLLYTTILIVGVGAWAGFAPWHGPSK